MCRCSASDRSSSHRTMYTHARAHILLSTTRGEYESAVPRLPYIICVYICLRFGSSYAVCILLLPNLPRTVRDEMKIFPTLARAVNRGGCKRCDARDVFASLLLYGIMQLLYTRIRSSVCVCARIETSSEEQTITGSRATQMTSKRVAYRLPTGLDGAFHPKRAVSRNTREIRDAYYTYKGTRACVCVCVC